MDYEKARQISKYRALGYTQEDIAGRVGLSQQTVSRCLSTIRDQAQDSENADTFFLGLILGGIAAAFLIGLLRSRE
ncbi:MAG: helix-turn-helix domain-containing protein [Thermoplasmata archaeon]